MKKIYSQALPGLKNTTENNYANGYRTLQCREEKEKNLTKRITCENSKARKRFKTRKNTESKTKY